MSRVEAMTAIAVTVPQARRLLMTFVRFSEWVAPDITVTPVSVSPILAPGDRFRMEPPGGFHFDYLVEAVTERELVFSFTGPWGGEERWSFVADGTDTIVRRIYDVTEGSVLASIAWRALGQALVTAHFKIELSRFRAAALRDPGPRAEIEGGEIQAAGASRTGADASRHPRSNAASTDATPTSPFSFPVDEG